MGPRDFLVYVVDNLGTRMQGRRCTVVQYVIQQIQVVKEAQLRQIGVYHPDPSRRLSREPAHCLSSDAADADTAEKKLALAAEVVGVEKVSTQHLSVSVLEHIRAVAEWPAPSGVDVHEMSRKKRYHWEAPMPRLNRISGLEEEFGAGTEHRVEEGLSIRPTPWMDTKLDEEEGVGAAARAVAPVPDDSDSDFEFESDHF